MIIIFQNLRGFASDLFLEELKSKFWLRKLTEVACKLILSTIKHLYNEQLCKWKKNFKGYDLCYLRSWAKHKSFWTKRNSEYGFYCLFDVRNLIFDLWMFQNCRDDGTSTIPAVRMHLWTWRIFDENLSKRLQNRMKDSTAYKKRHTEAIFCICCQDLEDRPFFRLKIQTFRNFDRPSILNIPSNFIFWYGTSKGHIQTKSVFPINDNLNHNLSWGCSLLDFIFIGCIGYEAKFCWVLRYFDFKPANEVLSKKR